MKEKIENVLSRLKADKRLAIIVIAGITGILLLTFSEVLPEKEKALTESGDDTYDYSYYEERLEARLESIISSIDGAGKAKVMLTLESSDENVYAMEHKQSSSEKSEQSENEYVLIDKDGDDNGLLLKIVEPEIRGVAIVCDGADSAQVKQAIISSVTAVLGITANRVSISKMNNGGNQ